MKDSNPSSGKKSQVSARKLREEQRARAAQRRRLIFIAIGALVVIAIGALIYSVATAPPPKQIEGVELFPNIAGGQHIEGAINYPQTPPVGGPHNSAWQNCGVYDTAIRNENAVHSMEHGAVWVTYSPDLPADQIKQLQDMLRGQSYILLSPYAGLPAPVVASAWSAQLKLQSAGDPRLSQFVTQYRLGPYAPERNASCQGGVGTPIG